ncbi:MAG: hypothetical protein FWC28_06255 [Proteobacteria bacterium]|nr:hypothetical protein [Cystobacterineae bacterium]MCL2258859.1 hypothetical protein [Cystobacterineae bacterium]MCL2314835.1 hypothetical protein [Pseudomonadota bacterium]
MKKFLSALLGAALLSSLVVTPAFAGKKAKAAKQEAAAVQVEEKVEEPKADTADKEMKPDTMK